MGGEAVVSGIQHKTSILSHQTTNVR